MSYVSHHYSVNAAYGFQQVKAEFADHLNCSGLLFRVPSYGRNSQWDSSLDLLWFHPQEKNYGDSLRFRTDGFQLGFGFPGKDVFWNSARADLVLMPGFSLGKFDLQRDLHAHSDNYRNLFFAPKLAADTRLNFGHFTFGLRSEYLFDAGKSSWRARQSGSPQLPGMRNRGFLLLGFIGFSGNNTP